MQKLIKSLLDKPHKVKPIFFSTIGIVLLATLLPTQDFNSDIGLSKIKNIDKAVHIIMFIVLGALMVFSYPQIKWSYTFIALVTLGIIIELLQETLPTHRTFEYGDIIADTIGVVLGIIAAKLYL